MCGVDSPGWECKGNVVGSGCCVCKGSCTELVISRMHCVTQIEIYCICISSSM